MGSAFVLLALRLAAFVNRYAVDIIYWDQWDFLQGLFDGADAWTLFRWQHGPQRQGIGNLIHAALYSATGWNTRADTAASAVMLLLAAAAALWLVKRVCGSLSPWDVAVPLIFLTTSSTETHLVVPNLAHGPVPALLLVGYGLALTVPSHATRCALLVIINFFAVNTGFTVLLGGITPAILLVQAYASPLTVRERAVSASGIAACAGTVALFFHGLVLYSATECFQFPHVRPWEYVPYTGFVLARPFGFEAGDGAPSAAFRNRHGYRDDRICRVRRVPFHSNKGHVGALGGNVLSRRVCAALRVYHGGGTRLSRTLFRERIALHPVHAAGNAGAAPGPSGGKTEASSGSLAAARLPAGVHREGVADTQHQRGRGLSARGRCAGGIATLPCTTSTHATCGRDIRFILRPRRPIFRKSSTGSKSGDTASFGIDEDSAA